ncbi:hypothetical protein FBU30_007094 [Linnemannia zychae]|nr:hypothetical protein FBU30_007094 [Linnemannia zychae]
MLRVGHRTGRELSRISAFRAPIHQQYCRAISSSTHVNKINNVRQNVTWAIGAGVVFTGVTLVLQSPSIGLDRSKMVYNDSPTTTTTTPEKPQQSIGTSLAIIFGFKKQPKVEQASISLDTDLTVTSWKQQEQDALVHNPGVMLWGSNKNGLVDPTGRSPGMVQIPQRLASFQGKVFRDLKLGDDYAAAVDEDGTVYQWGSGYNQESHQPEATLTNRDISQVTLCDTRMYGLSKDGTKVYVLPKVRPSTGPSKAAVNYQKPKAGMLSYVGLGGSVDDNSDPMTQLPIKDLLEKDERIISMSSGKNHMVMVTSHGRVLGSEDGLSAMVIGNSDFKQCHILEAACGEVHTIARDDKGRSWAWGINGFGQLAQGEYSHNNVRLPYPTLIKAIPGTEGGSECVKVAAGGQTSYFVLKEANKYRVKSAGMGQWGQLGDGTYTHIQGSLVEIAPLSNLAEFKEQENKMMPIGIYDFAIGSTHGFAVLDNAITKDTSKESTNTSGMVTHGRDVLSWGQNTYYQLLTGKRNNKTEPVHALPLDSDILQPADKAVAAIAKGREPKKNNADLSATNRLQLLPAQPRPGQMSETKKDSARVKDFVEPKIVAGNGVSGVYSAATAAV